MGGSSEARKWSRKIKREKNQVAGGSKKKVMVVKSQAKSEKKGRRQEGGSERREEGGSGGLATEGGLKTASQSENNKYKGTVGTGRLERPNVKKKKNDAGRGGMVEENRFTRKGKG